MNTPQLHHEPPQSKVQNLHECRCATADSLGTDTPNERALTRGMRESVVAESLTDTTTETTQRTRPKLLRVNAALRAAIFFLFFQSQHVNADLALRGVTEPPPCLHDILSIAEVTP